MTEPLASFDRGCNEAGDAHRFSELGAFVAEDVEVNGERRGLGGHIAGLEDVVRAFADDRCLPVDGSWVSAHFADTGTHRGEFLGVPPTGRAVTTQEFAFDRIEAGRIREVWVAADDLALLEQLR